MTGSLQGVRDVQVCQDHDKISVTVMWDLETSRKAAELSAVMPHGHWATTGSQPAKKPELDRSVIDALVALMLVSKVQILPR